MEYFFRHAQDPKTNINMSMVWIFLIIYLLFIYKFRHNKKLLDFQFIFIILVELSLLYWYYKGKVMFLKEGLPLYHCRIAAFMMPISYYLKKYKLANYFAFIAIIGPLVAYSIPDPSKYLWPHITNLTYILGHILSIGSALMILTNEKRELDFRFICKLTLAMNLVIYLLNKILSANYGYLDHLPDSFPINFPSPVLYLGISLGLVFLIYKLSRINLRKLLPSYN